MYKVAFVLFLSFLITSCSSYKNKSKIPERSADVTIKDVSTHIYSTNNSGERYRDHRMERVRDRGCADNSSDCGRSYDWYRE